MHEQPGTITESEMPQSRTRSTPPRALHRTMSARLWDIRWKKLFPRRFDEVTASAVTFDEALPFVMQHYARIFGTQGSDARFLADPLTETKRRFCGEMDVFRYSAPEGVVGVIMGHPTDWSTYYIRSAAFLPEYRNRHFGSSFLDTIYEPLRQAGCERIEVETSPANMPMVRIMSSQGFFVTSTVSSERWGYMLRFTKFLKSEAEVAFRRQYCVGSPPAAAANSSTPTQRRKS
jgi:ribosomal protein S18 acetylase RimI-like enzyme